MIEPKPCDGSIPNTDLALALPATNAGELPSRLRPYSTRNPSPDTVPIASGYSPSVVLSPLRFHRRRAEEDRPSVGVWEIDLATKHAGGATARSKSEAIGQAIGTALKRQGAVRLSPVQ